LCGAPVRRGDVAEAPRPAPVARVPASVVADAQILPGGLPAAGDRPQARLGVDAVLHQFGDDLQWIGLRQRDDSDGVPVITDPQSAPRLAEVACWSTACHLEPPTRDFEPA